MVVKVKNAKETAVVTLDSRKFIAWNVDHQPYHILMEDAIDNYITLKYTNGKEGESIEDGSDVSISDGAY